MNRDPPKTKSKRLQMAELALAIANDEQKGYSQKPPSGRWGPDFDCSSFIYFIANQAGYDVDIGGDKVRFTGTMLKDFEKAGFQILPFANVGISDLKIGDILLNLALHAEVYVGDGESVSANSAEDGGYVGEEGDQTGHEIDKHPVITFDKGWDYVLRPPDEEDEDEVIENSEEGDYCMAMNYQQPMNAMGNGWPQANQPMGMNGMNGNSQGMYPMNNGYPQGNLGQMNGYSQANANMRPPYGNQQPMNNGWQQGMQNGYSQGQNGYQQGQNGYPQGQGGMQDLVFVMGIEGAKNYRGTPNSRMALFDEDKPIMYVVGFDQNGSCNNINVYQFEECSEEMPQHLSPLMRGNTQMSGQMQMPENFVTREEFDQLKELLENVKSTSSNESNGSRNGQQSNGSRNGRNN
ncbi:MAG: hypothetical protein J6U54_20480 [Clostridiales bacterium]|nr:hypothetical protein [Clostridiales bacterium]